MLNLDWLAGDPASFDWPPKRHLELENRALAIAAARTQPPAIAAAAARHYGFTEHRGMHVPAAALAPAAAEIPIDVATVAAIAGARP